MQTQEYQKQKQHFVEQVIGDHCWNPDCKGKVTLIPQPEIFKEQGMEHLRIAKCDVCGKGWSFWTFTQWVKNRKEGARHTLKDAKDDKRRAREDYEYAMAQAKNVYKVEKARIEGKVAEARMKLAEE